MRIRIRQNEADLDPDPQHAQFTNFFFSMYSYVFFLPLYSLISVFWIRILAVSYYQTAVYDLVYVPIPLFKKFLQKYRYLC
jgi:hypothetical protein